MNLTEWGKSVKVAHNEDEFASTWLWFSISNLWRAYKIIVEIHTQRNSPHGLKVYFFYFFTAQSAIFKNKLLKNSQN